MTRNEECMTHFLKTGRFGPLNLGMARREIVQRIGEPDDVGCTRKRRPHENCLLLYGETDKVNLQLDMKLLKKLNGRDVQMTHGLAETLAEIDSLPADTRGPFCKSLAVFLDGLVSHYVFDRGELVVAHAGMKEPMVDSAYAARW